MTLVLPIDIKDQIGSGSLIIGLEIDTREEEGWVEKVYTSIFLTAHNWSKAKSMSLTYTKDQLNFAGFFVWYNYKAASQQLLKSWKDKRMTGLRFSWRIVNPTSTWTTAISQVGRSIQTPHFGEIFNIASDILYKAILMPPEEPQELMTNKSLVIELKFNKKVSDEVYAFTRYKLHKLKKSWNDADLHCIVRAVNLLPSTPIGSRRWQRRQLRESPMSGLAGGRMR